MEDGLPHRNVSQIQQDSLGFIWMGMVTAGLVRFDGHQYKQFTKTSQGLKSNEIFLLLKDANDWLWLIDDAMAGSKTGLNKEKISIFNPYTYEVKSFTEYLGDAFPQENLDKIQWFSQHDDGSIFIYLSDGQLYEFHPKFGLKTESVNVTKSWECKYGFHSLDDLAKKWNSGDNKIISSFLQKGNYSVKNYKTTLIKNPYSGTYWYYQYDNDELLVLHPEKGIIYNFKQSYPEITSKFIHTISFDAQSNVWIATDVGLYKVRLSETPFRQYLAKPLDAYNPRKAFSSRAISVSGDEVTINSAFTERYILNLKTNQKRRFVKDRLVDILVPLLKIKSGEYFSASRELYRIKDEQLLKKHAWKNNEMADIWSLYQDNQKQMWLGTHKAGLAVLEEEQVVFFEKYNEFDELKSATIWEFLPWDNNLTLLAASTGIYLLHPTKGIVCKLHAKQDAQENLIEWLNYLYVYRDKQQSNVIWGGTTQGLLRIVIDETDFSIQEAQQFTVADGLSSNTIYAVYEDNNNQLWLPSDYGIICFNKENHSSRAYTTQHGLSFNEFNKKSHFQGDDGTLYFGSMNGLNVFHPDDILAQNSWSPPLRITNLQQLNGETNQLEDKTSELLESKSITLRPDDKFFNLSFSLLEFTDATQIKYSYRIKGLINDWIYLDHNQLTASGFPYGDYFLEARAQGSSGRFSENQLKIPIKVLRPFYLQWWFLVSMVILFVASVYYWYRLRIKRLNMRQAELEEQVQARTQQIQEDKQIIEQQANELKNLDAVKSNFFANISHELRTPLTLMTAPIDAIIERNQLTNYDFTHLQIVKRNGERLQKMINEILDLSKLEANKLELNLSTVNWYSFIKTLLSSFESFATLKALSFQFKNKVSQQMQLQLDKQKLEIIVSNLLSNAFKFTAEGSVLFSSSIDDGMLIIQVEDTGRGILSDDLPHVFDRFFQTKSKDAATEGGTGIGLALSNELVKLMDGQIRVESELGKGTVFTIEIPAVEVIGQLADQTALEIEALNQFEEQEQSNNGVPLATNLTSENSIAKILLVEDNPDLSYFIKSLLADLYEVETAEHGKAALTALDNGIKPQLIISDVMMPIMDGFQLIEALKQDEHYRTIPLVMLTARSAIDDKLKALRIGVDDYLTKPFANEELLVRVENLLTNANSRKEINQEIENNQEIAPNETVQQWLNELELHILQNIDNLQLNIDDLADAMNVSTRQFYRQIKEYIGVTPNQYLKTYRLNHARQLLGNRSKNTVKAVAYAVGYPNVVYFSREFKKAFGCLPSSYL